MKHDIICLQELNVKKQIFTRFATYSLPKMKPLFSSSDVNSYEAICIYYADHIDLVSYFELFPGRSFHYLQHLQFYSDQFARQFPVT